MSLGTPENSAIQKLFIIIIIQLFGFYGPENCTGPLKELVTYLAAALRPVNHATPGWIPIGSRNQNQNSKVGRLCCLMSSDVGWHIRDKLRPMPKHGSVYSFTSTETRRLVMTDSPGRPPRLSHSSWTMTRLGVIIIIIIDNFCIALFSGVPRLTVCPTIH